MSHATQVSVEEYLRTSYDPDCDYVDGELEERNVGEIDHGDAQKKLLLFLAALEKKLGIYVIQEQRIQIAEDRFRVPDVCILRGGKPAEQIVTTPPLVCIEILSAADRMTRMQRKINDYLAIGVRYVWVLDPQARTAFVYTPGGSSEVADGVLRASDLKIIVPLAAIW